MGALRKITVSVPEDLLSFVEESGGLGVTEAVRVGLEMLRRDLAYKALLEMRGTTRITDDELRWMTGKDEA